MAVRVIQRALVVAQLLQHDHHSQRHIKWVEVQRSRYCSLGKLASVKLATARDVGLVLVLAWVAWALEELEALEEGFQAQATCVTLSPPAQH